MFGNLKVGTRLGLGFGVLVVLMLTIAVIGIVRLSALKSGIDLIVDDRYPKVVLVDGISKRTIDNGRILYAALHAGTDADIEQLHGAAESNRRANSKDIDKLAEMIASERGKELLREVQDKRDLLGPMYDQFFAAVRVDRQKAVELLQGSWVPANNAYWAQLETLGKYQGELMADSSADAANTYATARTLIVVLTIVALLLSIAIAWLITRSLLQLLGGEPDYAANLLREVAGGNLDVTVETRRNDDSSRLAA